MYIVNGRVDKDFFVGAFTYKTINVIDYLIANSELITFIKSFCISDFNNLTSDVHCALEFSPKTNDLSVKYESNSDPKYVKHWDDDIASKYQKYFTSKSGEIRNANNEITKILKL